MSRCTTITFHLTKLSKWLAQQISITFSVKIILWNRHVYFDIRLRWIWNHYLQLSYLKWWSYQNYRFAFISAWYSIKSNEPIWNWDSKLTLTHYFVYEYWYFQLAYLNYRYHENDVWLYFSSKNDYCSPNTRISVVHISWSELRGSENVLFSSSKFKNGLRLKHEKHLVGIIFTTLAGCTEPKMLSTNEIHVRNWCFLEC